MRKNTIAFVFTLILAAACPRNTVAQTSGTANSASAPANVPAATAVISMTNVVTVTVTNFVTVTNEVAPPATAKVETVLTNKPAPPPKYPWESSITMGLTLTRGNSDTMLFTGKIQTHKKTPENELTLSGDAAYGESSGVENLYTLHGLIQYNRLFTDRFYGYGRVEGLHDGIANLSYRITVGPGVGYYFLKETNMTFASELGSSFVTQKLGGEIDNYDTLRAAENFEYKFKKFGARFWENAEILPQINKMQNYLINAEVGIEAALNAHFSLKTFLDDYFNSEPAAGRQKNDIRLVSAVAYNF